MMCCCCWTDCCSSLIAFLISTRTASSSALMRALLEGVDGFDRDFEDLPIFGSTGAGVDEAVSFAAAMPCRRVFLKLSICEACPVDLSCEEKMLCWLCRSAREEETAAAAA